MSSLVQIMAWRRIGDKPLSEPIVAYWRIYASLGLNDLKQRRMIWVNKSQESAERKCTLQWRHNERDGVSNHQPHDCLLIGLVRCRLKKTSEFRVTGLCEGNSPVNSPDKRPVTRKIIPFDDAIMNHRKTHQNKCFVHSMGHNCPNRNYKRHR